jgi:hypothetical protein
MTYAIELLKIETCVDCRCAVDLPTPADVFADHFEEVLEQAGEGYWIQA